MASERSDIIEEYSLEGGWQAPEKTGFLAPLDDESTGDTWHPIVSCFGSNVGHPFYNMPGNSNETGWIDDNDAGAILDLPDGAEIDQSSISVDIDDALIRLARTKTVEDTLFADAETPIEFKNVIDFKVNIVAKPGFPRAVELLDDAKVGDVVNLKNVPSELISYATTIIGFIANDDGSVQKAVLNNNVVGSTETTEAVSIQRRVSNVSVPKLSTVGVNWRYVDSEKSVFWGGHDGTDPVDLTGDGVLVSASEIGTGEFECVCGVAYASYTAFLTDSVVNEISVIESIADVRAKFGDHLNPNNPLGWAVYTAKLNSGGVPVLYIQTANQTLSEYTRAVGLSEIERSCYSIVPCTEDPAIHSMIEGHIVENSDPDVGRFRIGWFAPEVEETRNHTLLYYADGEDANFPDDVYDPVGAHSTEGVEVLDEDGTAVTTATTSLLINATTDANNPFRFTGVGDLIYINASAASYNDDTDEDLTYATADLIARITSVTNDDTVEAVITVGTPSGAVTLSDETFIQSVRSGSDLAARYAQTARGFDNERIFMVVSDRGIDGLKVSGNSVKNIHAAAAFAGLRSTSAYQQPLSNVTINGFDGVNDDEVIFTERDMSTMRDAGVWLVRQPKTGVDAGEIFSQRQLSTSNLDIYRKEQSVTTNIDNISFSLLDALHQFVGRMNITPRTILLVRDSITSILREKTIAAAATLGPQLLSYEVVSIEQVEASLGTLKAQITLDVPLPMNSIDITLVV